MKLPRNIYSSPKYENKYFTKKQKILITLISIAIALFSWWAYVNLIPKPLGDKFDYIGKQDHGCYVGFCDSRPGSTYYYGTDMTPEDMKNYFKKARYTPQENIAFTHAHFTTKDSEFMFTYDTASENKDLQPTNKKFIIYIPRSSYEIARQSL